MAVLVPNPPVLLMVLAKWSSSSAMVGVDSVPRRERGMWDEDTAAEGDLEAWDNQGVAKDAGISAGF